MRIVEVGIKNWMIIKEVKFNPDGKLTLFAGKNEQGKTAILKAIESFFQGCNDPDVIRWGADKAEVMIRLDTGIWGKLAVTKSGQKIDVFLNEDGDKKAKPREYLKALLGNHSFDPIGLLTAKDRTKYLMEAFPAPKVTMDMLDGAGIPRDVIVRLDLTTAGFQVLKNAEAIVYERRTNVNARMKQKDGAYHEAMSKIPPDFVNEDGTDAFNPEAMEAIVVAISDLNRRKTEAETLKKQQEKNKALITSLKMEIEENCAVLDKNPSEEEIEAMLQRKEDMFVETMGEISALKEKLAEAEKKASDCKADIGNYSVALKEVRSAAARIKEHDATIATLEITEIPDIASIESEREAQENALLGCQTMKRLHEEYGKITGEIKPELDRIKAESLTLTAIIEKLREDLPAQLAKEAKIPIKNLRVVGEKAYIGDKSLDNLSGEESVTVALQILRETNKDALLKVFCVDGWEKLDDEHIEAFRQQIKEGEFQFLGTMVQHGDSVPEGAWIMEKGEIRKPKQPQEDTLFEVK
jgi:DNA repair ATPase RecN